MTKIAFGIETSCDETSVAILTDNSQILSHITINQKNHRKFGGVVPELASRSHLQILQLIIPKALKESKINISDVDIFCSTCGPGLIGGLLVGSTVGKSLALANKKPFYPINHLEGHILSTLLEKKAKYPNITFLLTGGHTQIYYVKSFNNYKIIGETVDDAIGECFDKVAKLLKLEYPGGPIIEKLSLKKGTERYDLPHPLEFQKNFNFSFSGIKTAVNILIKKEKKITQQTKINIAKSFQEKIVEILVKKLKYIFNDNKYSDEIKEIALVGGVASNKHIRESFATICLNKKISLITPSTKFCGDNAAMIALTGLKKLEFKIKPNINFRANPRLEI
tara:strand:+ start:3090 stop:4100 length:1011 start_codon:yes stop_codon:yes gene_type:complete